MCICYLGYLWGKQWETADTPVVGQRGWWNSVNTTDATECELPSQLFMTPLQPCYSHWVELPKTWFRLHLLFTSYLVGSAVWRVHNNEEGLAGEWEQVTRMEATTEKTRVNNSELPPAPDSAQASPVHFLLGLVSLLDSVPIHHISVCVCENSTKIIRPWGKAQGYLQHLQYLWHLQQFQHLQHLELLLLLAEALMLICLNWIDQEY